jgi:hypothetical protein
LAELRDIKLRKVEWINLQTQIYILLTTKFDLNEYLCDLNQAESLNEDEKHVRALVRRGKAFLIDAHTEKIIFNPNKVQQLLDLNPSYEIRDHVKTTPNPEYTVTQSGQIITAISPRCKLQVKRSDELVDYCQFHRQDIPDEVNVD